MTEKEKDKELWACGHHKAKEVRPDQVIPLEDGYFEEF